MSVGEERVEPRGVLWVGMALAAADLVAERLLDQRGERRFTRCGHELVDGDSGRHLVHPVDVTDHVLEHGADVIRADVHRDGVGEHAAAPAREPLVPAQRVLELGAVHLQGERRAKRGTDRAAEEHVIREHDIRGHQLAKRGRVRIDIRVELVLREVLQQLRVQALVLVEDERRQQTAGQVGHDDLGAAEVEQVGMPFLAHHDHLVAHAAPLTGKRARVDVRPRAAEQIAVPEKDAHSAA